MYQPLRSSCQGETDDTHTHTHTHKAPRWHVLIRQTHEHWCEHDQCQRWALAVLGTVFRYFGSNASGFYYRKQNTAAVVKIQNTKYRKLGENLRFFGILSILKGLSKRSEGLKAFFEGPLYILSDLFCKFRGRISNFRRDFTFQQTFSTKLDRVKTFSTSFHPEHRVTQVKITSSKRMKMAFFF